MQVAVYPPWGTSPSRHRKQPLPRVDDGRAIHSTVERGELFAKQRITGPQRAPPEWILWSVVRSRSVQDAEKTGEVGGGCVLIERWRDERRFTGQPSGYAPRPGK